MKPMIWHTEERDRRVNEYLDKINHAPYEIILAVGLGLVSFLTIFILKMLLAK